MLYSFSIVPIQEVYAKRIIVKPLYELSFLSKTLLFRGFSPEEIQSMMGCLRGNAKKYTMGSIIHHAGETISTIGLILSGSVSVENDDVWSNKSILDRISAGHIFAENYACLPGEPLMVNIVAAEAAEILFMHTDCMPVLLN